MEQYNGNVYILVLSVTFLFHVSWYKYSEDDSNRRAVLRGNVL